MLQRNPGDRPFVVEHSQLFSTYELVPHRTKIKGPTNYTVSPELAFDEVHQVLYQSAEPCRDRRPNCGKLKSIALFPNHPEVKL